jgi:SAM-dependent methyltransferase
MKTYQPIVCRLLEAARPQTVLDLPAGEGWLAQSLARPDLAIDGSDLYASQPPGYRDFMRHDLDLGIPSSWPRYDAIVSCEGIEHIANPGLFLNGAYEHLNAGGCLIVTTPNVWYPGARLQYFHRGFFPGFPPLVGKIERGTHMHIMPWTWPQLYLHLALAGFSSIELHPCLEDRRTRFIERIFVVPMRAYCRGKAKAAASEEERRFWQTAQTDGALLARRLVVSARKPQ